MNLITVPDAARRAAVSPTAIYYALSEGHLTRHEQFGKLLVDADELVNYKPRAYGDRPSRRRSLRQAAPSTDAGS